MAMDDVVLLVAIVLVVVIVVSFLNPMFHGKNKNSL
jgi:hypothetical protein